MTISKEFSFQKYTIDSTWGWGKCRIYANGSWILYTDHLKMFRDQELSEEVLILKLSPRNFLSIERPNYEVWTSAPEQHLGTLAQKKGFTLVDHWSLIDVLGQPIAKIEPDCKGLGLIKWFFARSYQVTIRGQTIAQIRPALTYRDA